MLSESNSRGEKSNPHSKAQKQQDDSNKCIFVGGIPLSSNYQEVYNYLSKFGPISRIQLPKDRQKGRLKGFAKAVFATEDGVRSILAYKDHELGGLSIGVSLWRPQKDYLQSKLDQPNKKVYVKFSEHISEEILRAHFSKFGNIDSVIYKVDPLTQEPRNFCYICFNNDQSAKNAVKNSGNIIAGQEVICELSKPSMAPKIEDLPLSSNNQVFEDYCRTSFPKNPPTKSTLKVTSTTIEELLQAQTQEQMSSEQPIKSQKQINRLPSIHQAEFSMFAAQSRGRSGLISGPPQRISKSQQEVRKKPNLANQAQSAFLFGELLSAKPTQKRYMELQPHRISKNHEDPENLKIHLSKTPARVHYLSRSYDL